MRTYKKIPENIFRFRTSGMMYFFVTLAGLFWLGALVSRAATFYVATNGPGGGATNWVTATNNIQDAISLATNAYDIVLVSNGVYETGGVTNCPAGFTLTNRVAITNKITVMSANNNPTNTIIKGAWDSAINGPGPAAVRCVYMVNTSSLIGFTLAQGATLLPGLLTNNDHKGAGVLAAQGFAGDNIIISNCVIISNWSGYMGGGVSYGRVYNSSLITNKVVNRGGGMYAGTMFNSVVSGNTSLANGGGMYSSVISNCTIVNNSAALGGGAFWGTLNNCVIANNSASASGGGTYLSALYNCLVTGNSANPSSGEGGGATTNSLHNCTIVSNSAKYGSGVSRSTNINCIIYNNSTNNWYSTAVFSNSCTTPTTTVWEAGNITNDPMFVNAGAGNYHLRMGSPCVNTGTNQDWMINAVDLDGNARILNTIVDMGAYETILRQGTIIVIY